MRLSLPHSCGSIHPSRSGIGADAHADTTAGDDAPSQAEIAQCRVRDVQALDYAGQIGRVREQPAEVSPPFDVSRSLADQDMLHPPATGRVPGLAQLGPGMVVGGRKTLMEIVPTARALIVTAPIKPTTSTMLVSVRLLATGADGSVRRDQACVTRKRRLS